MLLSDGDNLAAFPEGDLEGGPDVPLSPAGRCVQTMEWSHAPPASRSHVSAMHRAVCAGGCGALRWRPAGLGNRTVFSWFSRNDHKASCVRLNLKSHLFQHWFHLFPDRPHRSGEQEEC